MEATSYVRAALAPAARIVLVVLPLFEEHQICIMATLQRPIQDASHAIPAILLGQHKLTSAMRAPEASIRIKQGNLLAWCVLLEPTKARRRDQSVMPVPRATTLSRLVWRRAILAQVEPGPTLSAPTTNVTQRRLGSMRAA